MKKREEKNLGRMIVGKMMGEEKIGLGLKTLKLQFLGFNPGPFFSYHFAPIILPDFFGLLLSASHSPVPIPLSLSSCFGCRTSRDGTSGYSSRRPSFG